jgi:glycosyltransferase involved in cell wall biosynthesis
LEQELVSIIVPVYNVEKYLEKCVKSLTNQTYKNLEIILVDDGSPDACPKMCDDFAKQDARIKVIHKQNGGVMSAWKAGLALSSADLVSFIDSDDYFDLDAIEYFVTNLGDADMIVCGYKLVYENNDNFKNMPALKDASEGVFDSQKLAELKNKNLLCPNSYMALLKGNKLYRKNILLNNLKYSDNRVSWGDDCCIVFGAMLDSNKIVVKNRASYNYLQRGTSIVHKFKEDMLNQCEILHENFLRMLSDKNCLIEQGVAFEKARLLFALTKNIFDSNLTRKEKVKKYKELLECSFSVNLKENENVKNLRRNYQVFLRIFFSKNYSILSLFIKVAELLKK